MQFYCCGHNGAVCGATVCTDGVDGGYGASELAGDGNGLLSGGAIGDISGYGSALVGSTTSILNLLFPVYLAPELV